MIMQMNCPYCGQPAVLANHPTTYRRGDRTVTFEVQVWSCPSGCVGDDGSQPFRFMDAAQLRASDDAARVAWLTAYGEEMPPSERKPRAERMPVRRGVVVLSGAGRVPRFPLEENANPSGPHRRVA